MAPRRASTRRGTSTPSTRQRVQAGVRKNTGSHKTPNRYGQLPDPQMGTPGTADSNTSSTSIEEPEASTPRYSHSLPSNEPLHIAHAADTNNPLPSASTLAPLSETDTHNLPHSPSNMPINIGTMRELLRSHEQEIIDRVVLRLNSQIENPHLHTPPQP
ncbi:hypothetical protein HOY82DRAFT_535560 [Tuber indicum]|nr:hypothetical protein HOY82DRAFT_535560 [Tuber indicum]